MPSGNNVDPRINRRHMLTISTAMLGAGCMSLAAESPKLDRSRQLVRPIGTTVLNTRSKLVLELEGQMHVNEADVTTKKKKRDADVKATSTLEYFERTTLDDQANCLASARQYVVAEAEHWVSGNTSNTKLRDVCKQTAVLKYNNQWQQFSQAEPLAIDEVELLVSPINSHCLELLLPVQPAKANEPWSVSTAAAKELFNLEAAHDSTLTARITKVEQGVATMDLSGAVQGTINSVPTQLEIKGSFQVKLASQCAIVSWLGMVLQEKRAISQAEPGFEITARIRLLREEQTNDLPLTAEKLLELSRRSEDESLWIVRTGSVLGRYSFLASRQWKTYIDTGEEAIYRLISNNTIIAQCNVTKLPALDDGKQLTMAGLQAEIQKSLGNNFQSFLEASEKVTPSKLKLMRVVVSGRSEDVPIHWVYAHLSDDTGRRLSMVFTMGGNAVEQFAGADEQICGTLEMFTPPAKKEESPEVAPKLSEAPKSNSKRS
jgi:hypothetical protein